MKDSPLFFIIVFIMIFGIFYSPLKQNANQTTRTGSSVLETNSPSAGYSTNQNTAQNIKSTETQIARLAQNINKKIEESGRSPYYGKITLSSLSGQYGDDPNQEYVMIFTNLAENETVNITGWYLKSQVTGYFAMIGKAALLPFPFNKTESDVVLTTGDTVFLTKGFSPIGISFRTNKCTGYFEENRTFTPSLSRSCPAPSREKLPTFSSIYDRNEECLNILKRISSCTTVNSAFLRDLPDTVTQSCKNYMITNLTYNACVAKHFGDTNFPGQEYRLYLNKFGPLWRTQDEKISLYDSQGLIVDTITY